MYNPFPPTAGTTVGVLAITGGANSVGIAILALTGIFGGLVLLRTAQLRRREVEAREQ